MPVDLFIGKSSVQTNVYVFRVGESHNADDVVKELYKLAEKSQDEDIVLICYEKPGDFCHRHLVANWLRHQGYPVEEYKF